ncbi:SH3 and multiple ankyrin repeat domains protein 3 isoform X2 [Orussus abietinus]|uniref:SH3 and multiple ankyrin repeat domains protein 3 isoform X2 n=1 Tax=Orussus abietinus TaxID=222816 RepID=UPI000C715B93|nr:SH3 and multiple ankyrin repeat domains protein 3 isoform X2 [Orussus abietinus]
MEQCQSGTLTRVPSSEQYPSGMSGSDQYHSGTLKGIPSPDLYQSGTLTRVPSSDQYQSGIPTSDQYHSGTLTRVPSSNQYQSGMSTSDQYHSGTLKGVPSPELYQSGSLTRVPSSDQYPSGMPTSEQYHSGTLTRVPPEQYQPGTMGSSDEYQPGNLTRVPTSDRYQVRVPSADRYQGTLTRVSSADRYQTGTLTRVTSSDQYQTGNSSRVPGAESYPGLSSSESLHSNLNRVPSLERSRTECCVLERIPSEQHLSALSRIQDQSLGRTDQNPLDRLPSEYQNPIASGDPGARLPSSEHYQNLRIEGLTRLQEHRIELQHRLDIHRTMDMPPSPSPSSRSLAPFSSASSSLSEGSNQPSGEDSASIVTDKSLGDTASDVISDSSGVGTSQSDTTNSLSIPGTTVVCVESYNSGILGHLTINQGDILEVTGATDCGLLEGILRGQGTGLFPAHCVQEVRLRHTNIPLGPQPARDGRNRVLGRRESQHKYFATAPRLKKPVTSEPRTVVLHRSRKGFGFVLRGAKATSPLMELTPSARYPALQYLDDVDQGGVADLAGLRKGDFLIQINGENVTTASHEHVVDLIRKSGELVRMTVVSPVISLPNSQSAAALPTSQPIQRQYATLPRKGNNNVAIGGTLGRSPAPAPPRRDPKTTLSVGRARARSMVAGLEGGGEKDDRDEVTSTGAKSSSAESIHLPQQSSTGPNTGQNTPVQPRTASIRSRPTSSRITAAELEELFQRQQGSASGRYGSSMMSSHFQAGQATKSHPSSPAKSGRVYASVAEMKRKGKSSSRVRFFGGLGGGSDLHRDFHSTPDLNMQVQSSSLVTKGHRSQEDVNTQLPRNALPPPNHPPPPPPVGQVVKVNIGATVPDVVTPASVYDNMAHIQQVKGTWNKNRVPRRRSCQDDPLLVTGNHCLQAELAAASAESAYGVMSSFRPSNSAKLYASPEDTKTVGYRSRSLPASRSQVRKSHSLRTPTNGGVFKAGVQQNGNGVAASVAPGPAGVGAGNAPTLENGSQSGAGNQYAQPLKSTRGISGARERKKKVPTSSSTSNLSAPPIPEPDYSLSESENDETDGESEIAKELEKAAAREKLESAKETSGNSNTSGSSSGSGSLPHSFSVEEIQKVRTQLKSSKSYPNDFLLQQTQQTLVEDGDNSSSGVSSDQDVPVGPPTGFDDSRNEGNSHHRMTGDKEANPKRIGYGSGMLTRHAVSLAQLPPPLEADAEEQNGDLFVPPPPEFNAGPSSGNPDELVFAPPPQFCDNRQQNRVKIIGAIPKSTGNDQVKPPSGRLHSQ